MDTTLEAIGYGLVFRPIQTLAIGVFLYQAVAAMLRERRSERLLEDAAGTRVERLIDRRELAA